ncbi:MAG TPA: hypothetical protein DCM07_12405 [Planctomycetaceae bacterium]|nr:hypothetical protein [Planctomycetaceae bacterium]
MCGDPQATITNGCCFRQCKSGINRLFCSEEPEQVACVSVHCKLVTRATQLGAYPRQRHPGVKSNLISASAAYFAAKPGTARETKRKRF